MTQGTIAPPSDQPPGAPDVPKDHPEPPNAGHDIEVHVSYIRAAHPIHRRFVLDTRLGAVLEWALQTFGLAPSPDQPYRLVNDRTDQTYTAAQELESLAQLGFVHEAKLRLAVEHLTG